MSYGSSKKIWEASMRWKVRGVYGIDHRCADKKSWRVERRHWRHLIGLTPSFRKPRCSPPKRRTVKPGVVFENTAYLQWFENVKGCREAALHFFVKQIPTDSWHQVDSDRCNFPSLMPALTLVILLERHLVLQTAMPRGDIRKRPSAHL
jgi:hypothetical protein